MKLFWLDIETTGLDPEQDDVLEVGWVVTNGLEPIDAGARVLFHPLARRAEGDEELPINKHVREMHQKNQLWLECARSGWTSPHSIGPWLCEVFDKHFPNDKPTPAGRNVHFDISFMPPAVRARLSHRHFDVTTIAACLPEGLRSVLKQPPSIHRGLFDCYQEIMWTQRVARESLMFRRLLDLV